MDAPDEMHMKALGDEMSVKIKAVSKLYVFLIPHYTVHSMCVYIYHCN